MVEKLEQIREIGFWLLRGGAVGVAVSIRVFGRGGSYVNDFDLPSHQSIKNLHAEQLAHKSWDFESGKFRSKLSFMFSVRTSVCRQFHFLLYCRKHHKTSKSTKSFLFFKWSNGKIESLGTVLLNCIPNKSRKLGGFAVSRRKNQSIYVLTQQKVNF